jgi:ribosome-associated protein
VRASASESRSQARNRERALERLAAKLDDALKVEPARRATRPTKRSQELRVEGKRRHGQVKRGRRRPGADDE